MGLRGNTEQSARAFPSGATDVKACRNRNWMWTPPLVEARFRWLAHVEAAMPQCLHQVLMRFQMGCWELTAVCAPRVPAGYVTVERLRSNSICSWNARLIQA